ncbi:hypothetical protein HS125_03065 [bacterium]|nr:hypothetical protein [bacterium]
MLGRSHDRLNHRRRILWRLLYYDELVDVREIRLSRAVGEQELMDHAGLRPPQHAAACRRGFST